MTVNMVGLFFLVAGAFASIYGPASVNDVYLLQRNSVFLLEQPAAKIYLDREPFALRFFQRPYNNGSDKKYHAARIAVVLDRPLFDAVQVGSALDEFPMFQPGTGMAARTGGYDSVFISETGHHYVYYQNAANNRAQLIERLGNGLLNLNFLVSAIKLNGVNYPMADVPTERMFFIIVIDRNLDGVIQEGELTKLEAVF